MQGTILDFLENFYLSVYQVLVHASLLTDRLSHTTRIELIDQTVPP